MNNIDNIEALKENNILVIDNFLSNIQCKQILKQTTKMLWVSAKVVEENDQHVYSEKTTPYRTNKVLIDYRLNPVLENSIKSISASVSKILKIKKTKFEEWQISKYLTGEKFDFHLDCGCWNKDVAGEREKTVLLYVAAPEKGGETYFRALNHYIRPVAGRLIVWNNLLPNGGCNHGMIHAGLPVKKGIKITLNTWVRQKSLNTKIT